MFATILAAGSGTRMGNIGKPKCLLDLGGTSIIQYQIQCLKELGIDKIIVVTGFNEEMIKNHLGSNVQYVHLSNYKFTNNLYSVWQTRDILTDEFVCIYSDLFFHKEIIKYCIECKEDICLVIEKNIRDETMRVQIQNERIIGINKSIPLENADGNFIGLAKFSNHGRKLLFEEIGTLVKQENFNSYYTDAIESLIKKDQDMHFIETKHYPWMDIDTKEELNQARAFYRRMIGDVV